MWLKFLNLAPKGSLDVSVPGGGSDLELDFLFGHLNLPQKGVGKFSNLEFVLSI